MQSWHHYLTIEKIYVVGITDAGKEERYTNESSLIDTDDLSIAIELSGGVKLVLPSDSRILCDLDNVYIQVLE